MSQHDCPAALNIKGEHFPCDQMDQMVEGSAGHDGWAHSNRAAEATWTDDPIALTSAWASAEAAGR